MFYQCRICKKIKRARKKPVCCGHGMKSLTKEQAKAERRIKRGG